MAKYTGPVCRLCRREGEKLYLKGTRCLSAKCPFERQDNRRDFAPGQHGRDAQFKRNLMISGEIHLAFTYSALQIEAP